MRLINDLRRGRYNGFHLVAQVYCAFTALFTVIVALSLYYDPLQPITLLSQKASILFAHYVSSHLLWYYAEANYFFPSGK